ncbi:MAG: LPS-assembly lipoprotein LptE [Gammaproteobacteria bacterium]
MRRFLAIAVLALAAGCGFHLRGAAPLPEAMTRPYLDSADRFSPLHAALVARLEAAGAELAADPASASAVIRLHVDRTGRDLLSVAAGNKPGEYEVYYAAEYSVSAAGRELIPRQQVRLTRDYGFDETTVLAKEHEEQSLRAALAEEIAALMLRRFTAL